MSTALKAVEPTRLPVKALPTDTVDVDGDQVEIRSLSRSEAVHLNTAFKDGTPNGDVDGAEVYVLVKGVGVSEAEAATWRETTGSDTVQRVIEAILALSGMTEEGGKDPKSPGSEPS